MNELLKVVFSLSLSGTILYMIILLLKQLFYHKLSMTWHYYIWLLVILRMLLPFTPSTTLVGSAFEYIAHENIAAAQTVPNIQDARADTQIDADTLNLNSEEPALKYPNKTDPLLSLQNFIIKFYENLWVIWIAIALAFFIRKVTMYQSFVRFIKAGRTAVNDMGQLNQLADACEQLGIQKPIELYVNPLISSPMLLGFFRPYIILPHTDYEGKELLFIIQHELTHFKHLDMFYKWIVQFTVCLHWFNPFIYLLARQINRCCELCCDEAIIRQLNKEDKIAYGDTLLNSLKTTKQYNDKLAAVTLTESAQQLKERLEAIMKFQKLSNIKRMSTIILTLVLAVGANAIGAYASVPANQSASTFNYSQESYYQAPYIFEIGRNLNDKWAKSYPVKANLLLSDQKTITVYFDSSCKEYAKDENALASLKTLMESLVVKYAATSLAMEKPLISSVDYLGDQDLNTLAESYYSNNEMTKFVSIFPSLDLSSQKIYCNKMYTDGKIAFFAAMLKEMDIDTIHYFAQKSYSDNKVNFFSTIVPYLSTQTKNEWIAKSSQDHKNTFLATLKQQPVNSGSIQSTGPLPEEIKKLSLDLSVENGGVELLPSVEKDIYASFDPQYYSVSITSKNEACTIHITGKKAMMGKTDLVKLYLPNIAYNMDVNVLDGNFEYKLSEACTDEINISARNAGLAFTSTNQYKNTSISLTATDKDFIKYERPVYPDYFTKTDTGFTYSNGTKANIITVQLTGYTSVNFND